MKWPIVILLLSVFILSRSDGVMAGDSPKPFRIAMVLWRGMTPAEQGFKDFLAEKQLVVTFETYDLEKDGSRLPGVIREIKKNRPDLIYAFGTTVSTEIAGTVGKIDPQRHIVDIPIVFNIVADPVGSGLVATVGNSGRNLTGASHLVPLDVQMKAMRQAGAFTRIGVIFNPLEKNSLGIVEQLETIAPRFDFQVVRSPLPVGRNGVASAEALPRAVQHLAKRNVEVVYLPSDSFLIAHAPELIACINGHALPTFSATEDPIRSGGALMGIVSRYYNVGQLAGFKAWQILAEGLSPGDLPIETLKRFSLIVNMQTARKIDFYPPVSLLKAAEVVH